MRRATQRVSERLTARIARGHPAPVIPTHARAAFGSLALAAALLAPRAARAQEPDGVYGRLRADAVLSLEAGGGVALLRDGARPALAVTARARALDMAGFFLGYERAFGATRRDAAALGVELRPLMLGRIFTDNERGPRWLDLTVDSLGLEMGAALLQPGEAWRAGAGVAFVLGTGVDLPLAWSRGDGLLLRVGVRWTHARAWDAQGPGDDADTVAFTLNLVGRAMTRLGLLGVR